MLIPIVFALARMPQSSQTEIVIHNRKVAQFMRSGWLRVNQISATLGDVTVSIDTARNALELDGPQAKLRAIRDAITFFDVAPRLIKVILKTSSPLFGLSYDSSAVIENNSTWHTSWDTMKADVAITPRLNADGTITVFVNGAESGIAMQAWDRVKSGGWLHLCFSGGHLQPKADGKTDLELLVRADVQETPAPPLSPRAS